MQLFDTFRLLKWIFSSGFWIKKFQEKELNKIGKVNSFDLTIDLGIDMEQIFDEVIDHDRTSLL